MILSSIEAVGIVLILTSAGYFIFLLGWIDNGNIKLLTRLVICLALPSLVVVNMFTYMTPELLEQSWIAVLICALSVVFGAGVGALGCKIMCVPRSRQGLVIAMSAFSNSMFIGFPMVTGIYGDIATPYVLYFYIPNTVLLWTLGMFLIQRDAAGGKIRLFTVSTLKGMLSPPLIAFFISFFLLLLGLRPPEFALQVLSYFGSMVTPLSLIVIGAVIGRSGIRRSFRFERGMETVLFSRYLAAPAMAFALTYLCGFEQLGVYSITLMVAMPVMSQAVMQSEQYGGDVEFAAKSVVISTLLCLITIPFTSMLMPLIY